MVSHRHHPDTHQHGLQDDCERCRTHAENPELSLDRRNLRRLISQATDATDLIPTENDARATAHVLNSLERVGRLLEADPEAVVTYYRDHFRIPLSIFSVVE